jgi:hypothetical protein
LQFAIGNLKIKNDVIAGVKDHGNPLGQIHSKGAGGDAARERVGIGAR